MTSLNELVAIEVMGWKVFATHGEAWEHTYKTDEPGLSYDKWTKSLFNADDSSYFCPVLSISDAYRVVSKMREIGWWLRVKDGISEDGTGKEITEYSFAGPSMSSITFVHSETAEYGNDARSICIAALRAVGVSEELISNALEQEKGRK